jgi:hypothetical protein
LINEFLANGCGLLNVAVIYFGGVSLPVECTYIATRRNSSDSDLCWRAFFVGNISKMASSTRLLATLCRRVVGQDTDLFI